MNKKCKKIAFVRRNGIGDFICALPLIKHCQLIYPGAKVTLFLGHLASVLAPYLEDIDKVVIFPSKGNRYLQMLKMGWRYRKERFDLAISAKPSPMRMIEVFLWALGAQKSIAVTQKKHSFWVTNGVLEKELKGKHQALRVLQILAPEMQEIPKSYYPCLNINYCVDWIDQKLKILKKYGPVLLISLTNNRISSLISEKKYAVLLKNLFQKYPSFSLAISCMAQDREKAVRLKNELSNIPSEIFETTLFHDFLYLVKEASLLFIADGGIMHIAAAFNKPQLVLFGQVKKEEWWPLSDEAICLGNFSFVDEISDSLIFDHLSYLFKSKANLN